ncbi:MAG: hypothetical protein M1503_12325 [Thaumarchaeota archaeon]|nr:hypothetical protein [Nitrososphaerota archaeon]MCL5319026.1 hypothetical protein [Nitrososphaerota archaeon]
MRRALVSLPDGVWEVVDKELKGKIGEGDSEVIRNVMIAYLTEKGYLLPSKNKPSQINQIADEIEMVDTMINSLAEVLEERGQLNFSDWENRIRKKIAERTSKTQ